MVKGTTGMMTKRKNKRDNLALNREAFRVRIHKKRQSANINDNESKIHLK